MKTETRKASTDKRILIGMIVNRTVLAQIAAQWGQGLFTNSWSNLIGQWCIDYLGRYDKAPAAQIESIFETWAETANNKATVGLVEDFLSSISDDYENLKEEINPDYLLDLAGKNFNRAKVKSLIEELEDDVARGQVDKAKERIAGWNRLELGAGTGVDVLHDMEAIHEAFEIKSEPLIKFPKALGEFFGDSLERDGLIGVMGPDKRGKSFWLMEIAYRALLQRRKVAYFIIGDMSQHQVMRRLMSRIAGQPQHLGEVQYPRRIRRPEGERTAGVRFKIKNFSTELSWRKAWKAVKKLATHKIKSKKPMLRMACYPPSTISVGGLRAVLNSWEQEDWVPDVVVIDYADNLSPDDSQMDFRHQTNETWKRLRAMSQTLHCLVITATQTDAAAYKQSTITRSNFSEDKRKLAHVTGMIGLNQTPEEKELGVIRLNWVVRREQKFSELKCVHVAGCLALANPAVKSCW